MNIDDERDMYVDGFCARNEGTILKDNKIVYDCVRSVLVARLGGTEFSDGIAPLNSHNFPAGGGALRYSLEEGLPRVFRCDELLGADFGTLQLWNENLNENDRLTYDGICAYLALASNSRLVEDRQLINNEILRNAKEDMLTVDPEQDGGADKVGVIGEKYKELAAVATYVCDEAYKQIVKAEEDKIAQEDNIADAAQTYSIYMNDLNEMLK